MVGVVSVSQKIYINGKGGGVQVFLCDWVFPKVTLNLHNYDLAHRVTTELSAIIEKFAAMEICTYPYRDSKANRYYTPLEFYQ